MSTDSAAPVMRKLRIESIGEGTSGTIEATEGEKAEIARLLDLVALDRLAFDYRLVPSSGHRVRLTGRLTARVVQTCVVSLEPVASELDVPVEIEFWPEDAVAVLERNAQEDAGASLLDWPEPIADGTIDLGEVVYETFATSLDPYPKKAGASFEWPVGAEDEAAAGKGGPFAALERLKRR
jgi:uncharacterized metal-binding protein YceD (DUF177 family)